MMNQGFGNLRFGQGVLYLDDILIISKSEEDILILLEQILEIFNKNGLALDLRKCHFLKTDMEFLGYDSIPKA